jgi:aconitase A
MFNTYSVRRDDSSVMMRGAVANVRLDPWLFANHRLRVAGNGS